MNKWYLLPGMGADSSMYELLRNELKFEINFVDWPKYKGEKTYAETAKRVIEENGITDGDIVGGSSLGGMVALEIALQRQLKAVVLIGSAINSAEIQRVLSLLSSIASLTPISLIQLLVGKHNSIIAKMFAEANKDFIRAMCMYLPSWKGHQVTSVCLFRLHGQEDHIISCPKEGCETIPDAGHLVAITHTKECGVFLNKVYLQIAGITS